MTRGSEPELDRLPSRPSTGARVPPALRPSGGARRGSTATRWLGPATLAVAFTVGGLTLWRFDGDATRAMPPVPLEPAVAQELDRLLVDGGPQSTDAGSDAGPRAEPSTDSAPSPRSVAPARPDQAPARADSPHFEAVDAREPHGTLIVNTIPWTHVFVDGEDTGQNTPVRYLRVRPGHHQLGLRTVDGEMHTLELRVEAGETMRVMRLLQ